MKLAFVLSGPPVPKARPRLGRGFRVFTPQKTLDHEARIGAAALAARPAGWPMGAEMVLEMRFYQPTSRLADIDNLVKSVDGANGVAWFDDVQVVAIHATREIDRENPRTEVEILALPTSEATMEKRRLAYEAKLAKRAAKKRKPKPGKRLTRKRRSRIVAE